MCLPAQRKRLVKAKADIPDFIEIRFPSQTSFDSSNESSLVKEDPLG